MSITIDSDSALMAFKAELLKSLTTEQRDQLLSDAIGKILELKASGYGRTHSFKDDVMSSALSAVMRDTLVAILQEPEHKAKLEEAARKVVESVTEKIGQDLVAAVERTIRSY